MKLHTPLLVLLVLTACGSSEDGPAKSKTTGGAAKDAVDLAGGAAYFANTCIPCHGAGGKGDGAASVGLEPKPRDLTDKAWQASVDDEYLRKIIQYGGAAVGKQPTMPPNPVLGSKKAVLLGLVAHVRTLAK